MCPHSVDGDDQVFELRAQGLLCAGFAVDEANMFWAFAHAFNEVDQVFLVGVWILRVEPDQLADIKE